MSVFRWMKEFARGRHRDDALNAAPPAANPRPPAASPLAEAVPTVAANTGPADPAVVLDLCHEAGIAPLFAADLIERDLSLEAAKARIAEIATIKSRVNMVHKICGAIAPESYIDYARLGLAPSEVGLLLLNKMFDLQSPEIDNRLPEHYR